MEFWHNPRCSKSREAKALLDARGVDYRLRLYLDEPPSAVELDAALTALGQEPWEVVRMKEADAITLGLADWPKDRDRWITAMCAHPKLIERPLFLDGRGRAAIGRPPENVVALLLNK